MNPTRTFAVSPDLPVRTRTGFLLRVTCRSALLGLCLAACDTAPPPPAHRTIKVTDDVGRQVRLSAPAQRIASLIPARTDALLALGAADRLIARTRWDTDPRIASVPSVDNALTPSIEWLVSRQPDLVIAWPDVQSRSTVERLVQLGIPVYSSRVETLADVDRAITHLGIMLGIEARADSLRSALRAALDSVRARVAGRSPRTVAYLIGIQPPMAAGPGTFIDELITIAGGRNAFGDAASKWPMVSLEELLKRAPDVLVISAGEEDAPGLSDRLSERAGWRGLAAVREGRTHAVDAGRYNRPGPAVVLAVRELAALLHPELFGRTAAAATQ
jgi:iron complex transport system substrate-binding protein